MHSVKRILRIAIPSASLMLGATLYAASRSNNNCAHPSVVARVMQFAGLAHIQPCQVVLFNGAEICADMGHHCNVGNGPGKCRSVADAAGIVSCQCVAK